jgi:DNA polymerase II small subunit/DNA polymerase delta subunit B
MDAISISDLHLGSNVCRVKELESFLEDIHSEKLKTKELILNGDVL